MENGVILYKGKSEIGNEDIVVIATFRSRNRKTGNMIQVWILPAKTLPSRVSNTLRNSAACGKCMLQGVYDPKTGKIKWRVCYVNVGQACDQVWRAWKCGAYARYIPRLHDEIFSHRSIRWGAFGDPAAMPVEIIEKLSTICKAHTGYTHQAFWIKRDKAERLAKLLMISCHTKAQFNEADRRGWRAFHTLRANEEPGAGSVECVNYTHGIQCIDCNLCRGTSLDAKHVFTRVHGVGKSNLYHIQNLQGAVL